MTKSMDSTTITSMRCPGCLIGGEDALRLPHRPGVLMVHLEMRVNVDSIPDASRGVAVA